MACHRDVLDKNIMIVHNLRRTMKVLTTHNLRRIIKVLFKTNYNFGKFTHDKPESTVWSPQYTYDKDSVCEEKDEQIHT